MLKARKLLASMVPGERLEVVTTDPMSIVDMPVFCARAGHRIEREEKRESDFYFIIVRGPDPPRGLAKTVEIRRG